MAVQPSVVEYFNSRKRPAVDDNKKDNPNKILVLDNNGNDEGKQLPFQQDDKSNGFAKKLVYKSKPKEISVSSKKPKFGKPVLKGKRNVKVDCLQLDIRRSLFKCDKNIEGNAGNSSNYAPLELDGSKDELVITNQEIERNVPFHIKGALSPAKSKTCTEMSQTEDKGESENDQKRVLKTPESSTAALRKDLSLGNIKAMMSRSSRLEEMKAALKRFNENKVKLGEIQAKTSLFETPILDKNEVVDLDIPAASPMKTPKKAGQASSPQGKLMPSRLFATPPRPVPPSPIKSPMKSPAFQRYQALVTEGKPALILPFKYRALAEVFRCVDTVVSMLHNRKETITLGKLKPAVQEISRKNLTEYDLGQINTVFPGAFDFTIEKMRALGSMEKYELVITPQLSGFNKERTDSGCHIMMSPTVLLARQRFLFNALLELTKDHHEAFLKSLEPPMCIPRSRLTRWHPEFLLDDVPDIVSAALPQPPNNERVTSAKDLLEKARDLFVVNPRMERALQRLSENNSKPVLSSPATDISTSMPTLNKPVLHGVPASLLEKVRAKQAARALEAMTRTPAQAKEAVRLTRLPEIARIVRNLFVAEKKSVLPRELVLRKLGDSYRESLSLSELDDHLNLLAEKTPGWITFCNLRKTDFVKLSRSADMSRVMTRLEALAEEKSF